MKKKVVITILVVLLVIVGIGFVFFKQVELNLDELVDMQIPVIDLAKLNDGIYEGSYGEIPVSAKVSVTVKDHAITDIQIIEHLNGQGAPAEVIVDDVIEAQSLQVDVIAGATYSSKVLLLAISDALSDVTE